MKTTFIVSCSLFAIVLLVAMAFGNSLRPNEMASTIGGGNCARCPTSTNSSGSQWPCTSVSGECVEAEKADYKVCESYTHPDAECQNDDDVTAWNKNYCADDEEDCDIDTGKMDCSCHTEPQTVKGCV